MSQSGMRDADDGDCRIRMCIGTLVGCCGCPAIRYSGNARSCVSERGRTHFVHILEGIYAKRRDNPALGKRRRCARAHYCSSATLIGSTIPHLILSLGSATEEVRRLVVYCVRIYFAFKRTLFPCFGANSTHSLRFSSIVHLARPSTIRSQTWFCSKY